MKRSKIIFIVFAILFFAALLWVSYDISTRTTWPGSKGQLKERIKEQLQEDETDSSQTEDGQK
ncbi:MULTISPECIES: hypothetical protein [Persicobacter]|uniref:Uncharacterized protein n=1 Tax=Persicobacter diffluens TaxID=981 RepID=A0AAN4VXU5_9BACT|nr:hypothetical protein [Persicobacter sp. CCB-QB2]GJM60827.1 hypothetical protein PEDI_13790 [Persicobacter diffluens]